MRNNNTQGKTEFITEHIFWLALAWIWYRSLLFRCVPQHTLTESKLILLGFVLVFSAVGILFQMQNNRNGMGVFLDLVLGYGAYTVLTYWPIYPRLIKICLVAAGILSLLYAALVLCRRMRSRKYALKILRRRLGLVAFMSKKIVGMSLALIMGGSGASVLFGSSLLKSDVRPATKTNLSEQTIANNMDTILLLQEDEWEKLSAQERLDVLQTVANIEQRYLGLPNELNVGVANLDANILGYYTDKTHEIIVSADSLLYDSPLGSPGHDLPRGIPQLSIPPGGSSGTAPMKTAKICASSARPIPTQTSLPVTRMAAQIFAATIRRIARTTRGTMPRTLSAIITGASWIIWRREKLK